MDDRSVHGIRPPPESPPASQGNPAAQAASAPSETASMDGATSACERRKPSAAAPPLPGAAAKAINWPLLARRLGLTHRQMTVVRGLFEHCDPTAADLARHLGIKPTTLTSHLRDIRTITGTHSKTAIMIMAWREWEAMQGFTSKVRRES